MCAVTLDSEIRDYPIHSWGKLSTSGPAARSLKHTPRLIRQASNRILTKCFTRSIESALRPIKLLKKRTVLVGRLMTLKERISFRQFSEETGQTDSSARLSRRGASHGDDIGAAGRTESDDLKRLLDTPLGGHFLGDLLRGRLITCAATPELQAILHKLWFGLRAVDQIPRSRYLLMAFLAQEERPLHWLVRMGFKVLMLPIVAAAPPVQDFHFGFVTQPLKYSPRLKFVLAQAQSFCFVVLLTLSNLPLSGASYERYPVRDAYLLVHACGELLAELLQIDSLCAIRGPKTARCSIRRCLLSVDSLLRSPVAATFTYVIRSTSW